MLSAMVAAAGPRGGMVDTGDLKSLGFGRAGSSPAAGTRKTASPGCPDDFTRPVRAPANQGPTGTGPVAAEVQISHQPFQARKPGACLRRLTEFPAPPDERKRSSRVGFSAIGELTDRKNNLT